MEVASENVIVNRAMNIDPDEKMIAVNHGPDALGNVTWYFRLFYKQKDCGEQLFSDLPLPAQIPARVWKELQAAAASSACISSREAAALYLRIARQLLKGGAPSAGAREPGVARLRTVLPADGNVVCVYLCFDNAIAFLGQIMMRHLHAWLTGTPEGGTVAPCAVDLYDVQARAFLDHFDADMLECLAEQVSESLRCVLEMRRGDGVSAAEVPSAG
jgi:hypothetical protein